MSGLWNIYSSTDSSIERFINNSLHDSVVDKYANLSKSIMDNSIAMKLEKYFNRILQYVIRGENSMGTKDVFVEELIKMKLPIEELFNYTDMDASRAGIQFEKDLEKIAQTVFGEIQKDLGQTVVLGKSSFTGEQLKKIPVKYLDKFSEESQRWIISKYDEAAEKEAQGLYRLGSVQGKIDVKTPESSVVVSLDFSVEMLEFIKLMTGLNITAKNYTDISRIKFGSSSYFRVVTSVIEDLGYPTEVGLAVYYATARARKEEKKRHKYHLRYAYEVMGPGQYYDINGQLQSFGMTNFLFVFDKTNNHIYVRSTTDIVRRGIEDDVRAGKGAYVNLTK